MPETEDGKLTESVLTQSQAYEAPYRFVAQHYERERIVPLMLMLVAMETQSDALRAQPND